MTYIDPVVSCLSVGEEKTRLFGRIGSLITFASFNAPLWPTAHFEGGESMESDSKLSEKSTLPKVMVELPTRSNPENINIVIIICG